MPASSGMGSGSTRRRGSWYRAMSFACAWAISCRRMRACWTGDPVQVDQSALTGESLPATRKPGRGGVLRLDHSPGRNRRTGLCHGREDLFRQDRATGAGGAHRQPFPKGGPEDRQLPDHPRGGPRGRDHCLCDLPRRSDPDHLAVRPGADRGRDSRGDADGTVGDDGGWGAPARQEASRLSAAWWRSRNWPAWTCCAPTRPAP